MPDTQVVQELLWEERGRMAGVENVWGVPPLCLRASRQGGWTVLKKTPLGPAVEVVEIGKCS